MASDGSVRASTRFVASSIKSFCAGGLGFSFRISSGQSVERRWPVFEADDQVAIILGNEMVGFQDKDALFTIGFLNVAVLAFSSVRQPKVHSHRLCVVVRAKRNA